MKSNQLKVSIIGAGNMGGAIASSISTLQNKEIEVFVSDINKESLLVLQTASPNLSISTSNIEVIQDADVIILAVKPWLIEEVAKEIKSYIDYTKQIIVSIAAGIDLKTLVDLFAENAKFVRVIPNTAIEVQQGVSIISSMGASVEDDDLVKSVFSKLGKTILVPEPQLNAYMSLTSCGIAYAFRYIRAAMQGGVEMGIPAQTAKELVLQTLKGAVELMYENDSHPEIEIDKVTTPGGITIKGLNEMEAHGFTNAVIEGLKASLIK